MIQLRSYQEEAVAALVQTRVGICKAPAGSGKTHIAAAAIERWRRGDSNVRVLWVAHTVEQVDQGQQACESHGIPKEVVDFACYQSAPRAAGYDLFVGDEIHHIASPEFRKILDDFTGIRWGMSATPEREDDLKYDVFRLMGPIVYEVDRKELVDAGHLVKAKVFFHAPNSKNETFDVVEQFAKESAASMEHTIPFNMLKMANKSMDYVARLAGKEIKEMALELSDKTGLGMSFSPTDFIKKISDSQWPIMDIEMVRGWVKEAVKKDLLSRGRWQGCLQHGIFGNGPRNKKIIEIATANPEASLLILVGSIEHGNLLQKHIPGSLVLHSKMGAKKRRDGMAAFRDGSLKCAIATSLMDEGADVPRADMLILAAAGRSEGKAEQRTGRILRTFGEKAHGTVVDFWDRQHPLLQNQSRARAKVYANLDYEFCENEVSAEVLKAIGITSHASLPVGQTVRQKRSAKKAAQRMLEETEDDAIVNSPEENSENFLSNFGLHQPQQSTILPASAAMGTSSESQSGCINPPTQNDQSTPAPQPSQPEGPAPSSSQAPDSGVSTLAHAERVHARLSPSKLKYKAICSGFENDENSDKSAANRGSLGHECVEKEDLSLAAEDHPLQLAAQTCIDYKRAIRQQALDYCVKNGIEELIIHTEIKLHYFDQFGYCDELYIGGTKAWLLDWKFAWNFYAAATPQFFAYCVGVWNKYPEVDVIEVHVGHPFLDKTDVEIFNRAEHYNQFSLEIKAIIAKAELNRPEDYRVSEQCVYCGLANRCVALVNMGLAIGRRYAPELTLPEGPLHGSQVTDPAAMASLVKLKPVMEKAIDGWGKAALIMHDKNPLPGFRVVTREGKRIVSNPAAAYEILKENFKPTMTPEEFMRECSIPITTLDELVSATAPTGKKKAATANLTALLEDADAIKLGAPSRFLKPEKTIEQE